MPVVSHSEHTAWWSHKAIHSPSLFSLQRLPGLSSQQQRNLKIVPICFEACCQTWQWFQATFKPSHQSLRAEIFNWLLLSAFRNKEAAQLWWSSNTAQLLKRSPAGRRGKYRRKSCYWRLHRLHSSCCPWVLRNHDVWSLYPQEATDFFALRRACGILVVCCSHGSFYRWEAWGPMWKHGRISSVKTKILILCQ